MGGSKENKKKNISNLSLKLGNGKRRYSRRQEQKKNWDRESEHADKNINKLLVFQALTLLQTEGHIVSTRKGCPNQLLGGSAEPNNIIWESHDIYLASRTFFAVMYHVWRVSICQRLFFF